MSKIYFATTDGDIVDSDRLKIIAKIVIDKDIYDVNSIRQFAKICGGIVYEIEKPSVKFLLKHGHRVSAIKLYRDIHDDATLRDAMDAVNQIMKDMGL